MRTSTQRMQRGEVKACQLHLDHTGAPVAPATCAEARDCYGGKLCALRLCGFQADVRETFMF